MLDNKYFEIGEATVHQICHFVEDMAAYYESPLSRSLTNKTFSRDK